MKPPQGDELNQEMIDYFYPIIHQIYCETAGEMEHLSRTMPSYKHEVDNWFNQSDLGMMMSIVDGGCLGDAEVVFRRLCARHGWEVVVKYFTTHIPL